MPKVVFTANIQRLVECPDSIAGGKDVRTVLDGVFNANPRARGYILDDQAALRKHIAVFVDRVLVRDRIKLSDPVPENGTVYVMQALSGG
jgi:molybdopterin synthase sulfur carrier subunit